MASLAQPVNNPWIWSPGRDLAFFILPPLFILPFILFLEGQVSVAAMGALVMGIGGFGHHLPGFIRAYSDRDLFARYRARLTLVPILLIITCAYCAYHDLHAVTFAVAMWGTWHGAMQVNGFMRIYDSKVKSFAPITARLDWLMCLAWFGWVILHSSMREFSLLSHFYISGGPLVSPEHFRLLQNGWSAATGGLTIAYVANAIVQWRRGTPPSLIKLIVLSSSVLFFWYAMTLTSSLLLGVVMWEIFHDIQYNALIWQTQTQRVRSQPKVPWLDRFMFGPGSWRWVIYLLLIGGYGYIGIASSYLDIHFPEKVIDGEKSSRWMLQLIAVSALLHFYFDGFIWRIRNQSIRKELGIKETQPAADSRSYTTQSLSHALKWAFFFIPVGLLAYAQQHGMKSDPVAMVHNLAQTIPNSWTAHFMSATFHKIEGDYDQAAIEFQKTVQYNPKFDIAHMLLADVMFHKDSIQQSIEHYRIATQLEPKNIEAHANLAYLYLQTGQPNLAANHYWKALDAEPQNEGFRMGLATALLKVGRISDAEKHLREVLSGNPRHAQALNDMGMIRHAQGRLDEAMAYYQSALEMDTSLVDTRKHLEEVSALVNRPSL